MSLKELVEQWGRWARANSKDSHFMPIAWIGTGDYVFLNLDPDTEGCGCLMVQRRDSAEPDPLAPSFAHWLEDFVDELEGGVFAYSEEHNEVMLADELGLDCRLQ